MKIHLHHSHIFGKILGFPHDFCNTKVTKKSAPVIALKLFGFHLYYFIKGYIASAWCSKELNFGRTNLRQINFSNITGEIKFIDSLKYYQNSLAELASTLSDEEKISVKKLTEQFFNQHDYFCKVWPYLNSKKKEQVLQIASEGKSVIPYELIINMDSFFQTPENEFWEKAEFFSELKPTAVNDNGFENSKYLYQTLKMRNLGDMNDLYNAQDVILLCEIIENRFQVINGNHGFNPRKCNSASSLTSCIEREMSRIILALPTKLGHVEIFEQTVTGGFSSVNTRLAFVTQILLLNLEYKDDLEKNPLN